MIDPPDGASPSERPVSLDAHDELPAPPPAPPPPPPPPDLTPRPFRFTGSGSEYFRIWVVNLLLSLVTLGIYSAWAKVRRLRYFYGHTSVDGGTFGYHASPIAILKGRLLAYAVIGTLALLGQFAPLLASVLYLPLVMVMPIILVRAFRFRAANSSYRGIRFGFDGVESDAYRLFLFLPIAVPFTLGLLYPYVTKQQREFFVNESRHGRLGFSLELPTWPVYRMYLVAATVLTIWMTMAIGLIVASLAAQAPDILTAQEPGETMPPEIGAMVIIGAVLAYAGFGLAYVGVRTTFENLVWNHTTIDHHRFDSRLSVWRMLWIYASNAALIACTLGLAVPWARVRLAQYRAESLTLLPGGPILATADIGGAEDAAGGAELSDAMDLDFGL